jgi:hypothetical protein
MTHQDKNELTSLGGGVWLATEPIRIVGMKLATTMTVLQLRDGDLLLHSPIPLTPARKAAIEALGRVAHLYAPNTFHHLWLEEWARAFPDACVHAPAPLAKRHRGLRIDRTPDRARYGAFDGVIDEVHVDGFRLDETVLLHRPSRTLVVADLVQHIGRPADLWTVIYSRMGGFYDRVGLSRVIRWTAFSDRRAARRSIDAVLDLSFERVVVGHGTPILGDAPAALRGAFTWLPPFKGHPAALPGPTRSLSGRPCG